MGILGRGSKNIIRKMKPISRPSWVIRKALKNPIRNIMIPASGFAREKKVLSAVYKRLLKT